MLVSKALLEGHPDPECNQVTRFNKRNYQIKILCHERVQLQERVLK